MEPLAPWRIAAALVAAPAVLAYCLWRGRDDLKVVALCLVALTAYGMVQDQFSVRLCPEYFTVAHPPIEGLTDPTLLGGAWGFLATWWGGVLMGMALGTAATAGPRPPLPWRRVAPAVGGVLLAVAAATLLCGFAGHLNGRALNVRLGEPLASRVPPERHLALLAVACAHFGSYAAAVGGSVAACVWVRRERGKMSRCGGEQVSR